MAEHLINILPSTAIQNDTHFHKLYHIKPIYHHLRVFGCHCFPHIVTSHKLSPRSTTSVFLGYTTNHKGYWCLYLDMKRIIISIHVIFDETTFPFGSMTPNQALSYSFLDNIDLTPNFIHTNSTPSFPLLLNPTTPMKSLKSLPSLMSPSSWTTSLQLMAVIPNNQLSRAQPNKKMEQSSQSATTNLIQPVAATPVSWSQRSHPSISSSYPMVNRAKGGIKKPIHKHNLLVSSSSPIPCKYLLAFQDP